MNNGMKFLNTERRIYYSPIIFGYNIQCISILYSFQTVVVNKQV